MTFQVEAILICRARAHRCNRSIPAHLDTPMHVSARQQRNLRMTRHNRTEMRGARCIEADLIHCCDPRPERRVMHEDQGWLAWRDSELLCQPVNLPVIQRASGFSRYGRVKRDQAQRMLRDAIARRLADTPQVGVVGKRISQSIPIIMISGNEIYGHLERSQELLQPPVFLIVARVNEITGCQHDVGHRSLPHQMLDAARKPLRGIESPIRQLTRSADVQIGNLCDDHRWLQAAGRLGAAGVSAMALRLT